MGGEKLVPGANANVSAAAKVLKKASIDELMSETMIKGAKSAQE